MNSSHWVLTYRGYRYDHRRKILNSYLTRITLTQSHPLCYIRVDKLHESSDRKKYDVVRSASSMIPYEIFSGLLTALEFKARNDKDE